MKEGAAAATMMSPEITEDDVPSENEQEFAITIDEDDMKKLDTTSNMEEAAKDDDDNDEKTIEEEDIEDDFLAPYKQAAWKITKIVLLLLLVAYLLAAFIINFKRAKALFVITILTLAYMAYYWVYKDNEESFMAGEDRFVRIPKL